MPKINQSVETSIFDSQTGEMVEKRANKTLNWGAEPRFVKLYLDDLVYLKDLPKSYGNILFEMLKAMTYAGEKLGMVIFVNGFMKDQIRERLGLKTRQSVDNAISQLVKGNVLIRIGRGTYQANSYLFGKGDWQDIARLRLSIDYDKIKGRTFKAVTVSYDGAGEPENKQEQGA